MSVRAVCPTDGGGGVAPYWPDEHPATRRPGRDRRRRGAGAHAPQRAVFDDRRVDDVHVRTGAVHAGVRRVVRRDHERDPGRRRRDGPRRRSRWASATRWSTSTSRPSRRRRRRSSSTSPWRSAPSVPSFTAALTRRDVPRAGLRRGARRDRGGHDADGHRRGRRNPARHDVRRGPSATSPSSCSGSPAGPVARHDRQVRRPLPTGFRTTGERRDGGDRRRHGQVRRCTPEPSRRTRARAATAASRGTAAGPPAPPSSSPCSSEPPAARTGGSDGWSDDASWPPQGTVDLPAHALVTSATRASEQVEVGVRYENEGAHGVTVTDVRIDDPRFAVVSDPRELKIAAGESAAHIFTVEVRCPDGEARPDPPSWSCPRRDRRRAGP